MGIVLRNRSLSISGVSEAEAGKPITFTITSNGRPIEGVSVKVDNQTKITNPEGKVTFILEKPGNYTITAFKEGIRRRLS